MPWSLFTQHACTVEFHFHAYICAACFLWHLNPGHYIVALWFIWVPPRSLYILLPQHLQLLLPISAWVKYLESHTSHLIFVDCMHKFDIKLLVHSKKVGIWLLSSTRYINFIKLPETLNNLMLRSYHSKSIMSYGIPKTMFYVTNMFHLWKRANLGREGRG